MAKKILIADDEYNIVKLLSFRLQANGYEVIQAFDGNQAFEIAVKEKPDLILLDFNMPGFKGTGVLEKLKATSQVSRIPVIFVTAFTDDETKNKVIEMGARDFIGKPFDPEDVLNKIKKALEEVTRDIDLK
jgi:DNA-binding response OmpR family regulator